MSDGNRNLNPSQFAGKPEQLAMFMRPQEIKQRATGSIDSVDVHNEASWYTYGKYSPTLHRALKGGESIESPVVLYRPQDSPNAPGSRSGLQSAPWGQGRDVQVGNGHHRTHTADVYEQITGKQVWLPVVHDSEDYFARQFSNMTGPHKESMNPNVSSGGKPRPMLTDEDRDFVDQRTEQAYKKMGYGS